MEKWLHRWQQITAPSIKLQDEEQRHQAGLLASLALVILICGVPVIIVWIVANPDFTSAPAIATGMVTAFFLLYLLGRTRHYRLGGFLFILLFLLALAAIIITAPGALTERMVTLNFLVLAVLLAGILLSHRMTLLVAGLSVASTAVFFFIPAVPFATSYSYFVFTIIISTLIIVAMTRHQHSLHSLYTSEHRYRALFNQSNNGVAIIDLHGRFLEINDSAIAILGYNREELQQLTLADIVTQEVWAQSGDWGRRLGAGRKPPIYECTLRKKNGREMAAEINLELVRDATGRPLHIQSVFRDISERKKAEEMVNGVLDASPNAIIVVNEAAEILFANPFVRVLFGYEPAELIGQSHHLLIPERYHHLHERFFRRYFLHPEVQPMGMGRDLYARRHDGREFPAEIALSPIELNGEMLILASIIDITERKQAAERLARQEEQLRILVEQAPIGIITLDMAGLVSAANQRSLELLRLPDEKEIRGLNALTLLRLVEAGISQLFADALSTGKLVEREVRYTSSWNKAVFLGIRAVPHFNSEGEQIGLIILVEDMTRRVEAEEGMRQAQKLESLGMMAGGVAHDFNNLLVAMLGQTSLALAKMAPGAPGRSNIEKAETAARRAARLTHQLLAYSGRGHFQIEPLDLNRLLEENLHLFAAMIPKQIQLQTTFAAALPPIEADVAQMQQVVMNLIINAVEAMPAGAGVINIRTGTAQINTDVGRSPRHFSTGLPAGAYVVLEVEDNGRGMSADTLARIFDPFFSTKEKGHGLGLAAVLGIVKGHKGGLHVSSKPGEGTVFKLLFPVTTAATKNGMEAIAVEIAGLTGAVLIIDDEVPVLEAVADILALADIPTLTAADGETGLAIYKARQDEIGLVLLDLSMPGWDGDRTMRALRAVNPQLPIILSSGYTESEVTRRLSAEKVTGFLQKPYNAEKLLGTVRGHLPESVAAVPETTLFFDQEQGKNGYHH